nr:APO protein 4, mitochondrial [Tanacetum cinerariifolium]
MILKRIENRAKDYPVKAMIPVAYDVLRSRALLIQGVSTLLQVIPIWSCKFCSEVYIGEKEYTHKDKVDGPTTQVKSMRIKQKIFLWGTDHAVFGTEMWHAAEYERTMSSKYEEALDKFEFVLGSKPELNEASIASYNVACCYSKLHQKSVKLDEGRFEPGILLLA